MANIWLDVENAVDDLRRFVNDGPSDRLVKEKAVIGATNGVNNTFLTYEDRIIGGSLKVTVDYVPVAAADVSQVLDEDGINLVGEFTLKTAPDPTATVRAQYFYVFFLDVELEEGLQMALQELHETDDVTKIVPGLKFAALNFAGSFAYQKLAMRWAQKMSAKFLVIEEPANNDNMQRPNMFAQIAKQMWDQGVKLRDGHYMRHGRRNAPSFARFAPRIPYPYGPRT